MLIYQNMKIRYYFLTTSDFITESTFQVNGKTEFLEHNIWVHHWCITAYNGIFDITHIGAQEWLELTRLADGVIWVRKCSTTASGTATTLDPSLDYRVICSCL